MATTSIRIKVGDVELDYEGEASFQEAETGLLALVEKLQALSAKIPRQQPGRDHAPDQAKKTQIQMTTRNIAMKLAAKTGPELARAAIAHLAIVKEMPKFKRGEIHDQMKSATGIYKPAMRNNLATIIKGLTDDGAIIECDAEVYALTPSTETTLRLSIGAN